MRIAKTLLSLLGMLLLNIGLQAQLDTLIRYEVATGTVTVMPPVAVDTSIHFDHTPHEIGPLGNQQLLSLVPPTANLFLNSQFSDIARTERFMPVTSYPARTAIKLSYWYNDTLRDDCSGIMVGDQFVLTSAHCVFSHPGAPTWIGDSLLAVPAYDNGMPQPTLPSSQVEHCYIFKTKYDNTSGNDLALLQLRTPIGQTTGYVGMAFSTDTSYFQGKVFHKFSYPVARHIIDTTRVYNGDTMYYNYGYIRATANQWLEIPSNSAIGVPGQSGSTFLYTDNQAYYGFGVMNYANRCRHYQMNQGEFYQLKHIMDAQLVSVAAAAQPTILLQAYPNPFSEQTTVRFANPTHIAHRLRLCDMQGRVVMTIDGIRDQGITLDRGNLASGMYFFQLLAGEQLRGSGKVVVE
jgi:V8-like Glu-specific endopeptidase